MTKVFLKSAYELSGEKDKVIYPYANDKFIKKVHCVVYRLCNELHMA